MADAAFCGSCGEPHARDSKFCEHCGAERAPREARGKPPVPGKPPAPDRVEASAPGAGDLASQLASQLRTPTVTMALIGGAFAAGATCAIGLILALLLSDQSLLGIADQGKGIVSSTFAQMLNFVQAHYGDGVGKLGPALFMVFPIGACAVGAATQAKRTLGLNPLARLLSGAGVGIVFGLLMLVPALGAGSLGGASSTIEPEVLPSVLLASLLGVVGGLLGSYYNLRTALEPGYLAGLLPVPARQAVHILHLALRPLGLLLVLMTLAGTAAWTAETLLESNVRQGRSTPVATIDAATYAIEHGTNWTELAGLAQFDLAGASATGVPLPIGDVSKMRVNHSGAYRLFGFNHAMPAYTFAPLLIFMLASMLLLTLKAGYSVAQSQQPRSAAAAAAWGCLVGPIWALALVSVNALVASFIFGRADASSVFSAFLLGGLVIGALGGVISLQAQRRRVSGGGAGAPSFIAAVPANRTEGS